MDAELLKALIVGSSALLFMAGIIVLDIWRKPEIYRRQKQSAPSHNKDIKAA